MTDNDRHSQNISDAQRKVVEEALDEAAKRDLESMDPQEWEEVVDSLRDLRKLFLPGETSDTRVPIDGAVADISCQVCSKIVTNIPVAITGNGQPKVSATLRELYATMQMWLSHFVENHTEGLTMETRRFLMAKRFGIHPDQVIFFD